jgi:hypothetical protein
MGSWTSQSRGTERLVKLGQRFEDNRCSGAAGNRTRPENQLDLRKYWIRRRGTRRNDVTRPADTPKVLMASTRRRPLRVTAAGDNPGMTEDTRNIRDLPVRRILPVLIGCGRCHFEISVMASGVCRSP